MIRFLVEIVVGVLKAAIYLVKFMFTPEALRIYKLPKGTVLIIDTLLSHRYTVTVLDPLQCLVLIQGGQYKEPAERILGGSYGPGRPLWKIGYVRMGMALRMKDPKGEFQELEYPTAAVVSWEILPEEHRRVVRAK